MEIDEKTEKLSDSQNTNAFGFSSTLRTTPIQNVSYSAKLERTRNWVINSKPSLLQSLLKNNNKGPCNPSSVSLNTFPLVWPVDPQMCDNNTHVEPLEDLEGSSILSEFESYYTANSEISASNNRMNIPESSEGDSSRTSILDLDNTEERTNLENSMQEK